MVDKKPARHSGKDVTKTALLTTTVLAAIGLAVTGSNLPKVHVKWLSDISLRNRPDPEVRSDIATTGNMLVSQIMEGIRNKKVTSMLEAAKLAKQHDLIIGMVTNGESIGFTTFDFDPKRPSGEYVSVVTVPVSPDMIEKLKVELPIGKSTPDGKKVYYDLTTLV